MIQYEVPGAEETKIVYDLLDRIKACLPEQVNSRSLAAALVALLCVLYQHSKMDKKVLLDYVDTYWDRMADKPVKE